MSTTAAGFRLGPADPRPPVGTPEPIKPFAMPTAAPQSGASPEPAATPAPLPALPPTRGVTGARELPVRPRAATPAEGERSNSGSPAYNVATRGGVAVDFFEPGRATATVNIQKPRQGVALEFELPPPTDIRTAKRATVVARAGDLTARWTSYSDRLKEDLVVAKRPAADRIVLGMTRRGLDLAPDNRGGFVGHDSRGRPQLAIEAPTVVDTNGRQGKVALTVTADSATLQLDPNFLASATYPIVVDLTILYLEESASLSSGGYAGLVLADAPMAYFRLNELAGAPGVPVTVLDSIGTYTGRTVNDVTSGQPGGLAAGGDSDPAMRFEGTNRGHIVLSPGFADFSGGAALEAWVYPTADTEWYRILSLGNLSFWTGATDTISIGRYSRGGPNEIFFSTPTGSVTVPGGLPLNTWVHIVGSHDDTGAVKLYINGRLVASSTATGPIPGPVTRSTNYIGKSAQASWDGPFVGTIDEVAIYGHGLTAAQVQAHYLAGRPEAPPAVSEYANAVLADAPTAYWRMDDATVPVARDATLAHDAMYIGPVGVGQNGALVGGDGAAIGLGQPGAYVDLPSDQTSFSNGLTLEAWIMPTEVRAWTRMFMLNNNTNGNGNQPIGFLRNGGTNNLVFAIPSAGLTAPGVLTLNTWRHVVGTVTGGGWATLYVDGQKVTEGQAQPIPTTVRGLGYIGKSEWNQDPLFAGGIDEVALYNHALLPDRVAMHYAVGRGAPQPPAISVEAGENPITISWTPRDGVVKYDLWYQVDQLPAAHLAEVDGTTTSLGLHVSNDAEYRFGVQATNALGVGPINWSPTIHTVFAGDESEDDDIFDPAAEPPCIPVGYPDPYNFIQRLLLSRLVCGATQEVGTWRQASPLTDLMCPSLGAIVPRPGAAILSVNDPVCQSLTGTATASVGQQPNEGPLERIQRAVNEMYSNAAAWGISASALEGMDKILKKAHDLVKGGWYHGLNGYESQSIRAVVYAQSGNLIDVEAKAANWPGLPATRAPDLVVRMFERLSGGGTVTRNVFVEVKHWMQSTLVDDTKRERLQGQLLAYLRDPNHRVVLEFVQTKNDPITKSPSQLAQDLRLAGAGVDLTRVEIRILQQAISPAGLEFQSVVTQP
ncbi:MAG: hypothetical protein IT306_06680 [Chloroflexi bacterium]|nr:hypothetical protein [Chloroflexota bacterium]